MLNISPLSDAVQSSTVFDAYKYGDLLFPDCSLLNGNVSGTTDVALVTGRGPTTYS